MSTKYYYESNKLILFAIFIFSQFFSIRFFYTSKYFLNTSFYSWVLYIILSSLIFFIFLKTNFLKNFFLNKLFFYFFIVIFFIILLNLYPYADAMKLKGQGIDQDDCFKIIIDNILAGSYPYSKTYLGNPCSTGILEFILFFPVIFWDNYFSLVPIISILIMYIIFKDIADNDLSLLFIFIQISNLVFLEMSAAGSDFTLIGSIYLLSIWSGFKYCVSDRKVFLILAIIGFTFFYGSRVMLFFAFPINFFIFYYLFRKKAFNIFLIPFLLNLIIYLSFFIYSEDNDAIFHLFSKTLSYINYKTIFIFLFLIFLLFFFFKKNYDINFSDLLTLIKKYFYEINCLLVLLPMIYLIISSFFIKLNPASWEELNYILVAFPCFLFSVLKNSSS